MDQVLQVLRYHHYAYRTEKIYCEWVGRFDPRSGKERRHHIREVTVQRSVKLATKNINLNKRVTK